MRISTLSGAALATFALVMTLHVAQAATITVTTTQDEQAANGQCSLREAVQAANTDLPVDACPAGSGADTIFVPAGVYTLTITGTNVIEYVPALLEISSDVTIIGANRDSTIIKGTGFCEVFLNQNCPARNRLIYVTPNATVAIKKMSLNNNSSNNSERGGSGGGILNTGNLMLDSARIQGNAAEFGGGIYNSGTLFIHSTQIVSNSAYFPYGAFYSAFGGGIYNFNSLRIDASSISGNSHGGIVNMHMGVVIIDSVRIENNTGGGMANSGYAIIRNTIVVSNSNDRGAGIYSDGSLSMFNSVVTKNTAIGGGNRAGSYPGNCGGISAGGYTTITNSTISFNVTTGTFNWYFPYQYLPGASGGACLFGKAFIANSTFYNNTADIGGGVGVEEGGSPPNETVIQMQNVTISSNSAYSQGGGLRVTGGVVDLQYSTVASNTALIGSNIHVLTTAYPPFYTLATTGTLHLHNSLIAGGNSANCTNEAGLIESAGFNLSSDESCTALTSASDITNTNPLLGPLQTDWPGATPTHALLPGSPAINKGEYVRSDSTLTDQRYVFRRWGGNYADIGAYEVFDPSILRSVYLPVMQR